jgi:predicted RND superfamily exporter protein
VLLSLPLSIAGAIIALLVTRLDITTPVLIGMLMLMGIVAKNAIMLVDFAVEAVHHGIERDAAILDAAQKRARPIIMTTIAMVAGMAPSALAIGAGGEFRSPMAIAAIGGLLLATLLSLLFVPAVFTMMDDLGMLCRHFFSRFVGRSRKPVQHVQESGSAPVPGSSLEDADEDQRVSARAGPGSVPKADVFATEAKT